ncbi:MAG TPA: class I SAM-dependent methyltransferase [Pyrinomonadaceae bacterium]|nr:class I SAM-dependent methyltransferase [Pyrinomonadaceae bacterium]
MLRVLYRRIVPARVRRAVRGLDPRAPQFRVDYRVACEGADVKADSSWASPSVTARFKKGVETFDLGQARRSPSSALASPIVRDNLSLLDSIGRGAANLLDFGCGNGLYRVILAHHAPTARWAYTGADVNLEIIEWCRGAHAGARFEVVKQSGLLPFGDGEFDVVLASGVLQCVSDYEATLAELRRVTSGYVVVSRLPVWVNNPTRQVLQSVRHPWGRENHLIRVFNRGRLEDLFARLRLEVSERGAGSETFDVPGVAERAVHNHFLLRKF